MPTVRQLRGGRDEERYSFSDYVQWLSSGNLRFPVSMASDMAPPQTHAGVYASNGIVFACMALRQSVFAEVSFRFAAISNGRTAQLFGGPELDVLQRPWPNGSTGELAARMIQDVDLVGNFYAVRDGARIYRRDPTRMSLVLSGNPAEEEFVTVAGYAYQPGGPGSRVFSYSPDQVCHWCADEETEILTAQGWKTYQSLHPGEEVLTLNHQSGLSEWQPVSEVLVFPAERREMVSMESTEFSSLTTANHRWPVEYRIARAGTYGRRWVTSDTIGAGDRIPTAAYCADVPIEPKWSDALVELVAWFYTEGRFKSGSRPGRQGRGIQIAQSSNNADNVARIRAALRAIFGAPVDRMPKRGPRADLVPCWRESLDDDMAIFSLSANASDLVTQQAPGKVVTTDFIRALTSAQLDLFITVSLLADNNGPRRLAQKSPVMAEQFALACILAGHSVSIRPGSQKSRGYRMTNVRIMKKRHVYPQENRRETSTFRVNTVAYDGHVWCPRTPNQTWLARRHGSVYFTGNSPLPDPEHPYRGMSWLTPVLREVRADNAATDHKAKFFANGATPNMVVKFPPDVMTKEQFKVFKTDMDQEHAGAGNAYKTLYLAPGADIEVVGKDFQQLAFDATQGRDETRIASAAGVPAVIVGLKESLQGSSLNAGNYGAARRRFADATMRPLYRSASAALETLVPAPTRFPAKLWYDDSQVAFFREDRADAAEIQGKKAQTIRTLVDAGYDPVTVVAAVDAEDMTLLQHSGLYSVQLQEPGATVTPPQRSRRVEHDDSGRIVRIVEEPA